MSSEHDIPSAPHSRHASRAAVAEIRTEDLLAELARRGVSYDRAGGAQRLPGSGELQRVLDVLPVGVFLAHDRECSDITMNAAGAEMLGLSPGTNPSKTGPDAGRLPFRVLRDGVEVPASDLPMQAAARLGSPVTGEEFDIERSDGSLVRLYEYASALHDEHGRILGALGVFVDVTGVARVQRALRESESRLALLTDAVPALISYVDRSFRYQLLNRTYERWLGVDVERALGRHVREVLGERTWQSVRPHLERALGGEVVSYEQELPYPNPVPRWVRVTYTPDRGPDGDVRGIVVLVTDIAPTKRAEAAQRSSEAEFRVFFELSAVGMSQVDPATGAFVRVNRRFCEIIGYDEHELIGASFSDLTHPDDRERDLEVVSQVMRGARDHWEIEKRYVRKNGVPFWAHVTGRLIRDARGQPFRTIAIVLDITERKRAEEALRESQSMLAQSQRMAHVGSFEFRLAGSACDQEDELLWSDETYLIFGYAPRSVAVDDALFRSRVHPEDLERVVARGREALLDCEPYEVEYRIVLPDGSERVVQQWALVDCDSAGRPCALRGTCQDVTDHVRLQRERLALLEAERGARAEAERANRSKDEFLATLGHELRTPLNAILGWTYLLRRVHEFPDKVIDGIEVIERNARAQTRLVSDLLDLSRISSGKLRLEFVDLELARVVEAAIEAVRPGAAAKGLSLGCELAPVPAPVRGDPGRLRQALTNLLDNAIKFTPRGGRVDVSLERGEDKISIVIADTGRGIAPEFLPQLFSRFRQADSSAAREHGGLGIGLALVRQLTELHGGSVRAESAGEGTGTTFTLELPRLRSELADALLAAGEDARSGGLAPGSHGRLEGLRVLVVDDEADALDVVRRVLEDAGAKVQTAGSSDDALARLVQPFDVILSDIGMPGTDGYGFLGEVRRRGIRTPAGALTAFTRVEDRLAALQAGFQRHIPKPAEAGELLREVLELARIAKA